MPGNPSPIFSAVGDIQGGEILTAAAADVTGQGVNNVVVFTANAVNGGFVQRLRAKPLGTNVASVLRMYINNGLHRLATALATVAGTPTGTPSAAGGTLASGNYFAKIVAVDGYGGATAPSTETAAVAVTGPTGSITWNWTAVAGAVSYRIYVGPVTGGQVTYFTSTTNSLVQTAMIGTRDSIGVPNNNNWFYGELTLPATTASANSALLDADYPLNLALPPGYRIICGLGTAVAAGWQVGVIGGAY